MDKFPDKITMGEKYSPVIKITEPEKAREYFELCIEHNIRMSNNSRAKAEEIERSNIAYYAGYYDLSDRLRVEKLFQCAHPIFGAAAKGEPTPKEAFAMGKQYGERIEEIYDLKKDEVDNPVI